MRTPLSIGDDIRDAARELVARQNGTIGEVVSELAGSPLRPTVLRATTPWGFHCREFARTRGLAP